MTTDSSSRAGDRGLDRRAFLGLAAASGLLAGCLGDDDTESDDPEDDGNDEESGDDTENGDDSENGDDTENGSDDDDLDPEELRTRAREFVELLAAGEFETAEERVDPAVVTELNAPVLEAAWDDNVAPLGDLLDIVSVEFEGIAESIAEFVVTAEFEERTQLFDVAYTDEGVAGFFIRPQTEWTVPGYVDEAAFTETDLDLDAPGDCSLGATLTVPEGGGADGSVPGVVIVHGSGPVDRDLTTGPNRPYRELAWGLATRGIAVLRYDKRTHACDPDLADVTIDDVTTDDAVTAVQRLREHDRVADVFVAGHSLGGLLAPRIAERDGDLAGVVMLAPGPARSMADTIVDQQEHLLSLDETLTDEERAAAMAEVEALAERIRTLDIDDDEVLLDGGREYYESLAEYDHTGTAAGLDFPVGIFQGGQDWQVTVEDDLPIWEEALDGAENVEITVYDDLNHRFQQSDGERTRAEYFEPNPVAETLVADVAAFVASA